MEKKSPNKLRGQELADALESIPFLRAWANAVEQHALGMLVAGKKVPGYKLVRSQPGHRRWNNPAKVLRRLKREGHDMDDVAPRVVLSPAQLEKVLNTDEFEEVTGFIERPKGKVTIAPVDDPRDPVKVDDFDD